MKKIYAVILALFLSIAFSGCSDNNRFMNDSEIKDIDEIQGTIIFSYVDYNDEYNEYDMNFVLYYKKAPITVTNFVKLVKDNFYNGTYCTGYSTTEGEEYLNIDVKEYNDNDPKQLVQKELNYYIKGEFAENGWDKNDTPIQTGTMYMIRGNDNDTASAPFSICLADGFEEKEGHYAVFGRIEIDGVFLSNFRNFSGSLENMEFIVKSITINTQIDLGEPLKINK